MKKIGMILRQTNPASVERLLKERIQDELGKWRDLAIVQPRIHIEREDGDLSGNITDGYGTIHVAVCGVDIQVPFLIKDKQLLPFDVIRLGGQEVSYAPEKLQKLVVTLDAKRRQKEQDDTGGEFNEIKTMELADPREIQYHNGFLGTIMDIRDENRNTAGNNRAMQYGYNFGNVTSGYEQVATDTMEIYEGIMEKIAQVVAIPKKEVETFTERLVKQAAEAIIEGTEATNEKSLEVIKAERVMDALAKETLVHVDKVASGNDIVFPYVEGLGIEYRNGRVYHNFTSMVRSAKATIADHLKSIVFDFKGHYVCIENDETFMTTLREPIAKNNGLETEDVRTLRPDTVYFAEINEQTISYPFEVVYNKKLERSNEYDPFVMSWKRTMDNTLFENAIVCKEMYRSKRRPTQRSGDPEPYFSTSREFVFIVSAHPITDIQYFTVDEMREYIERHAKDREDAKRARDMLPYEKDIYLVPPDFSVFRAHTVMDGFIRRPDALKRGILKSAAFGEQNRATLIVESDRLPRIYTLKWSYIEKQPAGEKLKQEKVIGLSESQARTMLQKLGYSYQQQDMFFAVTARNGRQAELPLPNVELAAQAGPTAVAEQKKKSFLQNLGNATLHAKNFVPGFEDMIADIGSTIIADALPRAIPAAQTLTSFFGKGAAETAEEIEKIANKLRTPEWTELAYLTNLKMQLDKLAEQADDGYYLDGAPVVMEKVAELEPAIQKQARSLIDLNRTQLLKGEPFLVRPGLLREALHALDGLSKYAYIGKKKREKTAGLFSGYNNFQTLKILSEEAAARINAAAMEINRIDQLIRPLQTALRTQRDQGLPDWNKARQIESKISQLEKKREEAYNVFRSENLSKMEADQAVQRVRNLVVGIAGIPALAGISFLHEKG